LSQISGKTNGNLGIFCKIGGILAGGRATMDHGVEAGENDSISEYLQRVEKRERQVTALRALADYLRSDAASIASQPGIGLLHETRTEIGCDVRKRIEVLADQLYEWASEIGANRGNQSGAAITTTIRSLQKIGLPAKNHLIDEVMQAFAHEP
jgi:hypothetical protein